MTNELAACELLPCPFCGDSAYIYSDYDEEGMTRLGCISAECFIEPHVFCEAELVDVCTHAWNRRFEITNFEQEDG